MAADSGIDLVVAILPRDRIAVDLEPLVSGRHGRQHEILEVTVQFFDQ
jgi:hypothetical protein